MQAMGTSCAFAFDFIQCKNEKNCNCCCWWLLNYNNFVYMLSYQSYELQVKASWLCSIHRVIIFIFYAEGRHVWSSLHMTNLTMLVWREIFVCMYISYLHWSRTLECRRTNSLWLKKIVDVRLMYSYGICVFFYSVYHVSNQFDPREYVKGEKIWWISVHGMALN